MPVYPRYVGPPLPKELNPLHPQHYLMLLGWIFFNPSRLKQYLWQTDPELYQKKGFLSLFKTFSQPGYAGLWWMSFVIVVVTDLVVNGFISVYGENTFQITSLLTILFLHFSLILTLWGAAIPLIGSSSVPQVFIVNIGLVVLTSMMFVFTGILNPMIKMLFGMIVGVRMDSMANTALYGGMGMIFNLLINNMSPLKKAGVRQPEVG